MNQYPRHALALLAVGGLLLALPGCDNPEGSTGEPTAPREQTAFHVTTAQAVPADGNAPLLVSGTVTSQREARPSFKTGGLLSAVLVEEGESVRRGQPIARIDATELRSGVAQAEAGLDKARRDLARAEALFADSVATRTQRDDAATAVALAERQLESLNFDQGTATIAAPFSGKVVAKLANAGETVGPGQPVARIQGTAPADWRIEAALTDAQWAGVRVGDSATFELDAYPGRRLPARVTERASAANPSAGTFNVTLRPEASDVQLAAGLIARVTITKTPLALKRDSLDSPGAVRIPITALARVNGFSAEVYTLDGETVRKRQVGLGPVSGQTVRVEDGLVPRETVVTSGVAWLRDGDRVRVEPLTPPAAPRL